MPSIKVTRQQLPDPPDIAVPVLAATRWQSNADMILDLVRIGYIRPDDAVLDPTFGRGKWWSKYTPANFTFSDLKTGVDFRDLPHANGTFDVVTYDPPYVRVGGRDTTGMADHHDRYGLTDAPRTPALLQQLIDDGMTEMFRVTKPGGLVIAKCQDYQSGPFHAGTFYTTAHALALGFRFIDRFEHLGNVRPQPPGRPQRTARRNYSTCLIFRKPRRPKTIDTFTSTIDHHGDH
jgi:hypothetical protein